VTFVPSGRGFQPASHSAACPTHRTGQEWEQVGVQPDIKVDVGRRSTSPSRSRSGRWPSSRVVANARNSISFVNDRSADSRARRAGRDARLVRRCVRGEPARRNPRRTVELRDRPAGRQSRRWRCRILFLRSAPRYGWCSSTTPRERAAPHSQSDETVVMLARVTQSP